MSKERISLGFRIKHIFTHHLLLKIISLFLAVIVWLYVQGKLKL